MKTIIAVFLSCFVCTSAVIAQMPECHLVYLAVNNRIYNFDPSLPVSQTNPVLNTIISPGNDGILAICPKLNSSSTINTFYTISNGEYYYYDGAGWINTRHGSKAANIAGGGGYIFNIESPTGKVYRYDGIKEKHLVDVPPLCSPYDLIADCDGNWYLLNTTNQPHFLRKYDSTGVLLKSWPLINPHNYAGYAGFGIIGNNIYFDTYLPAAGMVRGTIGDSAVVIDPIVMTGGLPAAGDFATCPSSINLSAKIQIACDRNDVCPGMPVTYTSTVSNAGSSLTYQWRVNGVIVGGNTPGLTHTPVNGDVVSCTLTFRGACSGTTTIFSNEVRMVVLTTPVKASVRIRNTRDGFCQGRVTTIAGTQVNGGTPVWRWFKNGIHVGTNSDQYTDSLFAQGDEIYAVIEPAGPCTLPVPATSDTIKITALGLPVVPGININSIPPTALCAGTSVTFVSNVTGEGARPRYIWYKNDTVLSGVNTPTYTDLLPRTGDTFKVDLISSEACPVDSIVPSNKMGLTVTPVVAATVSLTALPGTGVARGQYVTFMATPVNGGVAPGYQWYRNGMIVSGVNTNTWTTNTLENGDFVNVHMESKVKCPLSAFVSSNTLQMQVSPTAVGGTGNPDQPLILYPNPNNGSFTISINNRKAGSDATIFVEVLNAIGQQVYRQDMTLGNNQQEIPVQLNSALADGYYLLRLHTEHQGTISTPFTLRK